MSEPAKPIEYVPYPRPGLKPVVNDEKRLQALMESQFLLTGAFAIHEFGILMIPLVERMHYARDLVNLPHIMAATFYFRALPQIVKNTGHRLNSFLEYLLVLLVVFQRFTWFFLFHNTVVEVALATVVAVTAYIWLTRLVHAELRRYGLALRGFAWQRRQNFKADLAARLAKAKTADSVADLAEIG